MQPIQILDKHYPIQELTLGHAINIAQCQHHEQKLSLFLQGILADDILPYQMNAQQRHYTLLHYLKEQGEQFQDVDLSDLMLHHDFIENIVIDDITFRHLNGFECEAIERLAKNRKDYILMSLVLTIGCEQLPEILPCTQIEYACKIIQGRLAQLHQIGLTDGAKLIKYYYLAQDKLNYLLNLTFDDDGIVIFGENQDCPMRFCPSYTLPTIITELCATTMD